MESSKAKEYFVDVNAFMETREKARKQGIQHFSHEHLLILKELTLDLTTTLTINNHDRCNACRLAIRGSAYYTCSTLDCVFNLHEFCALLPENFTHLPDHNPQHKLAFKYNDNEFDPYKNCDLCHRPIEKNTITYRCLESTCHFESDLRCATLEIVVKEPGHRHTLTPQLYPASFLCSICGETDDEESLSYQCRKCSFWIHDRCYPLPRKIKHSTHPHPIHLSPQYMDDPVPFPPFTECGVCKEEMMAEYWFYHCPICNYIIHIKCSSGKGIEIELPKLDPEELKSLIMLPLPDSMSVQQTITQLVKKFCQPEEEEELSNYEKLLHHPGHDCPLILCEKGINNNNNQVCDACVLPILDLQFYTCLRESCKFFLHKWCANLRKELQFTHHPEHKLVLVEKKTDGFGFYECQVCHKLGNGFAFKCRECKDYYIDVKCASLPRFIMHVTHDHPLFLIQCKGFERCYCCGHVFQIRSDPAIELAYGCVACHVYLQVRCMWLPQEIEHWYDKHPYSLVYEPPVSMEVDGSDYEYYCEFCERKMSTSKWFYHCNDCDRSAETKCIDRDIRLYPRIKYGGSYVSSFHPQHPLTCARIRRRQRMENSCMFCHDNVAIASVAFECSICKILLHLRCALKGHSK